MTSNSDSDKQRQEQAQNQSACPHLEAMGKRWGDPISPKRQAELQSILDAWNASDANHGERRGPFHHVQLTGAEVCWLAEQSGRVGAFVGPAPNLHLEGADLEGTHLEGATLNDAHLEGATLSYAHLEGADLERAHLQGATLGAAHLQGASLVDAHLERADLMHAHLKGASLVYAHLQGADLNQAHLEEARLGAAHLQGAKLVYAHLQGANLFEAHLEGANVREAHLQGATLGAAHLEETDLSTAHLERTNLRMAHLKGAKLVYAHLQGADLFEAHLEGADLRGGWFDNKTLLTGAIFNHTTKLGDIQWSGVGNVNLTQINWTAISRLGDEQDVGLRSKLSEHEAVVRAYRQVAAQLRTQGMSEVADRFSYRAQVRQRWMYLRTLIEDWRRPWRLPGDLGRYLGSAALALLAGYGYRPGRTIFWYLITIAGFAAMFLAATNGWVPFGLPAPSQLAPLPWYEALILSVSSFHGRGFFQPLESLGDPVAALAAIEAVVGLLIEVSFIATFTQRFFGAK